MSDSELLTKFDQLRSLPAETEWVEFKQNYADPEDIGEYISALSNAAALAGKTNGYLVWGVENGTHRVVGTAFKPRKAKGKGDEDLEPWLGRGLTPRIDFRIHELTVDGKAVVLFEIPAASSTPVRFRDAEFIRVGSHKQRLREHEGKERRLWAIFSATSFEEGIAATGLVADDVLDRLDYSAFFRLLKESLPENKSGILARLESYRLVAGHGRGGFHVTNLGAILFARDLNTFGRLARKAIRVIKYAGTNKLFTEKEWTDPPSRAGYAVGFDAMVAYVNSQLPTNEHIGEALRQDVRMYPGIAIRELTANVLIHQDFSVTGSGPTVEIFDDRIEFTNPGEPLVEPQRFIDMPPRSRNEELARLMRLLDICEERGTGIDKVVAAIEMFQLPPPDFRKPPGSTHVVLYAPRKFAQMDSVERVRACYQHCVLCWVGNTDMTNATLRKRLGIADKNYSMASRILTAAVKAKLIKQADEDKDARKYIPYWA